MASADAELERQLKEVGKQLSHPPDSVDELLPVLDKVEKLLLMVDQSPKKSMVDALKPSMNALIKDSLLKHSDIDVKVAVASCISEITRITAPDAPYTDDQMRDVFELIVSSFEDLADRSSRSYKKRAAILETVSKVRSCVIMLDLECDELVVKMFEQFLKSVRDYHLDSVFSSMESIMVLVIDESEEISVEMLKPLLASVKTDRKGVLPVAHKLAKEVLLKSAEKLKPYMMPALTSLGESLDMYHKVVAAVCEGTTASFENKDDNDSGLQPASECKLEQGSVDETQQTDESKLTTASSDQVDQVVKAEVCPKEEVDPIVENKPPKSVMSNGVNETLKEEASVDQESKKLEDDKGQPPVSKENTDDSDAGKLAKENSQTEKISNKSEKEADTTINPIEPSDTSHVEGDKESEKDNDVKESENEKDNDVKEAENDNEKDNDVKESENEAVIPSEPEKDKDTVQESSPKAVESKPEATANVSSTSQSSSVPDEKPVPQEVKLTGKKTETAKEVKLVDTVNKSEDGEGEAEASSDSDAKPLKKSEAKSKSTKQSGKKSKQSGKKSDVGEIDTKKPKPSGKNVNLKEDESDSDSKPLKLSVKKVEKSKISVEEDEENDSDTKPLKLSAKKGSLKKKDDGKKRDNGKKVSEKAQAKSLSGDDEMDISPKSTTKSATGEKRKLAVEENDSDNKPLKLSAKRSSSKKKDDGKKHKSGKNVAEKDQAKSLSGDDEMDVSPKSAPKSTETPVTSAKRKRSTGKDEVSGTIKYDESLIGTKVKVWWPEDKMYYEGVVEEFYPAKKKHKVSYLDGDEEILNLKTQKWEILEEFSVRDDEEQNTEVQSEEGSPEIPKKKTSSKTKTVNKSKEDEDTLKTSSKTKTVNKSKGKTPPSSNKSNTGKSSAKEPEDVKSTENIKGGSNSGKKRKKTT